MNNGQKVPKSYMKPSATVAIKFEYQKIHNYNKNIATLRSRII